VLDTDAEGKITGGRYYGDSARIDMLWTPLKPVEAGEKGNERGNPHVSVKEVLAIWRESVSEDIRKQWLNVDPTEEDAILPPAEAIATTDAPATPAESPTESPTETTATESAPPASPPAPAAVGAQPAETAAPATPAVVSPAAETPAEVPPPAPTP
jgi:hypothetical protein